MIDAYTATYAAFTYASQTTTASLTLQQGLIGDQSSGSGDDSDNDYGFSLGYTTTTTVATYSLLVVQESRDFGTATEGNQEKSALQTVLEGPKDPFNPLEDSLASFYSDDPEDDHGHSDRGNGHKHGHAVRDNTYGHAKNDFQAAYSVTQLEVTTTSVEISLVA